MIINIFSRVEDRTFFSESIAVKTLIYFVKRENENATRKALRVTIYYIIIM